MNVLIADNDPIFRAVLSRRLKAEEVFQEVWEAEDGEQAVLLALAFRPDLILMDVALAGIGGLNATLLIKAKMPEVRVIVVSAPGGEPYEELARRSGADAFFAKSICWSTLNRLQGATMEDLDGEGGTEAADRAGGEADRGVAEGGEELLWASLRNLWSA